MSEEQQVDREVLAAVFASMVQLAKKSEDEAAEEARTEHRKVAAWVRSNSQQEKSFLWYCDEFDLSADAVRRAIKERKQ